jgi:predicted RNA-binding protein with PUA-like domain
MPFLVKEEPEHYSFDDFLKDHGTTWSGVRNPLAQKHLRSIKKGDLVFYYHTGAQKAVVGVAKAATAAYPDPADRSGKAHVVDLVPVKKLRRPVTLAEVKADRRFADFPLTYMPRLSVMPVTDAQWKMILSLAAET